MHESRKTYSFPILALAAGAAIVLLAASAQTVHAAGDLVFGTPHPISRPSGEAVLTGISCPSLELCVAVDSKGEAIVSTNLAGKRPTWSTATIDTDAGPGTAGVYLTAISCPTATMCAAVDSSGRVVTSTNPARGSAAWTVTAIDGSHNLRGISCPTRTFCAAVDDSGNVITTTHPTGGTKAWTVTHVPAIRHLTAVSCPTPRLCVATAQAARGGTLVTSTHPTAGPRAWALITGASPHPLASISCPSPRLCVATDIGGEILAATVPSGGRKAWTRAHVNPSPSPRSDGFIIPAVNCPTTTFCLAVDDVGKALWSNNPTGGASAWNATRRPGTAVPFLGVACPTHRLCIAIDEHVLLPIEWLS